MERRDFLKSTGVIWLSSTLLGSAALSCNEEDVDNPTVGDFDITKVNDLVENSFKNGCIDDDRFFMSSHYIIVAESFEVVKNLDKKRKKADFILNVRSLALVKANFDLINTDFNILDRFSQATMYKELRSNTRLKSSYKAPVSYTLATDNPKQSMNILKSEKLYEFSLILANDKKSFIDHKKIPLIINREVFAEIFRNNLEFLLYE